MQVVVKFMRYELFRVNQSYNLLATPVHERFEWIHYGATISNDGMATGEFSNIVSKSYFKEFSTELLSLDL